MDTLEQLHRRIATLHDLRTVVRTMKAMSAASMRQSATAAAAVAHYDQVLERALQIVLCDHAHELVRGHQAPRRLGALVLGTEHGLCGPFNDRIADVATRHAAAAGWTPDGTTWWAVGQRIDARLRDADLRVAEAFDTPASSATIGHTVQAVVLHLDRWRRTAGPCEIHLFHHAPRDGTSALRHVRLFPASEAWMRRLTTRPTGTQPDPDKPAVRPMAGGAWRDLYAAFVTQHLYVTIYRALAESLISEQTARLHAMQVAERNLDDRLEELQVEFHSVRQSTITAELLDVVGGFEALQ